MILEPSALLGRRNFYSEQDRIGVVKSSKNYNSSQEKLAHAKALKIFQTSKQQTWLVSTNERLYCILDDNRKDDLHINWSIPKRVLVTGNEVSIKLETRDHSEKSGLVDIGSKHKNWLYSKKLFKDADIKTEIQKLITETMF